jgi:hypothetical protein
MSNAGGMSTVTRYTDMLAGNTTWNPWEPDGAFDALSAITVPAGGVASITFAGIPNTYKHLQVRMSNTVGATIRFNGDTTGSNYRYHVLLGNGSSAASGTDPNNAYSPADGTTGNTVEILDILDYANTSKNKTLRSLGGFDANGSGVVWLTSNLWMSTAAINSLVITATIPQNAKFSLYGVK